VFATPLGKIFVLVLTISACHHVSQDDWLDFIKLANNQFKAKHYLAAEKLYVKAKTLCEMRFGHDDARTATCLAYLAELYRCEQEYVQAALTYERLIAIEEQCNPNSVDLERFKKEYKQVLAKVKDYGLEAGLKEARAQPELKM